MRKIKLNMDLNGHTQKPTKEEIRIIQNSLKNGKIELTVEELEEHLNAGATMKAGALNGNKNIDWESQEVFPLDFDNDEETVKKYGYLDIKTAIERCDNYRICPAFYYKTFSSTEEHVKFRLNSSTANVFSLDAQVYVNGASVGRLFYNNTAKGMTITGSCTFKGNGNEKVRIYLTSYDASITTMAHDLAKITISQVAGL